MREHICDLVYEQLSHFWPAMGISGWQVTHQCHPISNERFIHLENGAEVPAVFFDLQN